MLFKYYTNNTLHYRQERGNVSCLRTSGHINPYISEKHINIIIDLKKRDLSHHENTPMQYTAVFQGCKNDNFQLNFFFYFFHIFAQNIYCGYTLESPH